MKKIATLIVAMCIALSGMFLATADAHTPSVGATCNGVVLKGSSYDANKANKWSVTINGVTQSGTFGASLDKTFPVDQDGKSSTWSGTVQAFDGSYAQTNGGTVGPCGTTPTPTPVPTPTPSVTPTPVVTPTPAPVPSPKPKHHVKHHKHVVKHKHHTVVVAKPSTPSKPQAAAVLPNTGASNDVVLGGIIGFVLVAAGGTVLVRRKRLV